jgi:hypothetical protein
MIATTCLAQASPGHATTCIARHKEPHTPYLTPAAATTPIANATSSNFYTAPIAAATSISTASNASISTAHIGAATSIATVAYSNTFIARRTPTAAPFLACVIYKHCQPFQTRRLNRKEHMLVFARILPGCSAMATHDCLRFHFSLVCLRKSLHGIAGQFPAKDDMRITQISLFCSIERV